MSVSFYRLGSNMRVPLKASAQVVALAAGASVKTPLAWDFVNNQVTTAAAAAFAGADIATTAVTLLERRGNRHHRLCAWTDRWPVREDQRRSPGGYNGTVVVLTVGSATTFTYAPASAPGGSATTQGNIGAVAQADIRPAGESHLHRERELETVNYDSATGFATEQHRQLRAGLTFNREL